MKRKFTKYPSSYVRASNWGGRNQLPKNMDKISRYDKDAYDWSGAQIVNEDDEGEWFIVEGEPDSKFYHFKLVCVYPDGRVEDFRGYTVERDTYTTEKALDAMAKLDLDYWDFYS